MDERKGEEIASIQVANKCYIQRFSIALSTLSAAAVQLRPRTFRGDVPNISPGARKD